jgi:hydrogenase 3 maturation protease
MKRARTPRTIDGLAEELRQARRLAVVGIGSELRGDDCAGLLVIRELRAALGRSRPAALRLFDGGTAPENLTGAILRWQPSHILLVDAADLGLQPGAVKLIAPEQIAGLSFSTHALPLKLLADYLSQAPGGSADANAPVERRVLIVGLQPGRTDFGRAPSVEIKGAARRLAREILRATQTKATP